MAKRELSKVEEYVIAAARNRELFDALTKEEREQAAIGLRWLELHGTPYVRTKRGRPVGAKNKATIAAAAEQTPLPEVTQ